MTTWEIGVQDKEVQQLMKQDNFLAKLIRQIGDIQITMRTNPLKSLIRSIVGQQISVKAATSIFQRLTNLINDDWSVDNISKLDDIEMKEIGMSDSKIKYVKNLIEHIQKGHLNFTNLKNLNDSEVVSQLTQVKGIGEWTAEVFLLFTLQRLNVLPTKDVGLQKAAQWLYQTEKSEKKQQLSYCYKNWEPYSSIGAFYLWEAIHHGCLEYDSIDKLCENK